MFTQESKAFTIVEVMISLTIFAFTAMIATSIYLNAMNLEKKSADHRVIQENILYIMELLAKEVRNGRIDYAAYGGTAPSGPTNELRLLYRDTGLQERICWVQGFQRGNIYIQRQASGGAPINYSASCSSGSELVQNNNVTVPLVRFYISPSTVCSGSCRQQRVTALIQIRSTTPPPPGSSPVQSTVQSTFSVRLYNEN